MMEDDPTARWAAAAAERLDALAKPAGSLGRLERLACRLAAAQGTLAPETRPRRLILFAGDHGVVAEGTGPWPQEVTAAMIRLILDGRACSTALARAHGADVKLVDVGSLIDPAPHHHAGYADRRVRRGTRNLASEAAMTVAELDAAWRVGVEAIETARHDRIRVVALGEMGIGNTTPAACITSLLTGRSAEAVTGTGAGVASGGHARKIGIVSAAVERAGRLDATDRRAALASVAGLEVAALAGAIAAGARAGVTVLLDGFIVAAAALMAEALAPGSTRSVIAAHAGSEPGHRIALTHLGLEPFLEWDLRLGEGTGALLLLPLVDSAAAILKDVARLDELGGP